MRDLEKVCIQPKYNYCTGEERFTFIKPVSYTHLVRLAPNKVVYVSCGPETLVRDLKYLTKHGYRMKECTPCLLYTSRCV